MVIDERETSRKSTRSKYVLTVAATIGAAALSLLVSLIEGEYEGYRRATQLTLQLITEADRYMPFPPSDVLPSVADSWDRAAPRSFSFQNLAPRLIQEEEWERGQRAFVAAFQNQNWLEYCDTRVYEDLADFYERVSDFSRQLRDAWKELDQSGKTALTEFSWRFRVEPLLQGTNDTFSMEKQDLTSPRSGVCWTLRTPQGRSVVSMQISLFKANDTAIEFVPNLAPAYAHCLGAKANLVQGAAASLARMHWKGAHSKFLFLFLLTYVSAGVWIVMCWRERRRIEITLNVLVLLTISLFEPMLYLLTSLGHPLWIVGPLEIKTGWADWISNMTIVGCFLVYTCYYVIGRRLLPRYLSV